MDRRFPEQKTTESLSGIPQGSVLEPSLFIIYVNDLLGAVESITMMFAGDTKVYRSVNNQDDHIRLQSDLDNLLMWADKWQLQFNASKCKVIHYRRKNKDCIYYESRGPSRQNGGNNRRKFSTHVAKAANKGNQVIGAIRCSFRYMDKDMLTQLYKALV